MKKILSTLGIITLTTTANINVIACGGDVNNKIIQINLSNLPETVSLKKIAEKSEVSFAARLINFFNNIKDFSNLSNNDIDIFKKNTNIHVIDDDIVNGTLNITIQARTTSKLFTGSVDVSVTVETINLKKIDLDGLPETCNIKKVINRSLSSFTNKLLNIFVTNQEFNQLSIDDIYIYKKGTKEIITSNDIGNGTLSVTIQAQPSSLLFTDSQDVDVTIKTYEKFYSSLQNFVELTVPRYEQQPDLISFENFKPSLTTEEVISCELVSVSTKSQKLIKSEISTLRNNDIIDQIFHTQIYSEAVTNSYSVTNTFSAGISTTLKLDFLEVKISLDFSHSTTQTTTTTDTITAPSQEVTIHAKHKLNVLESLYNNTAVNNCIATLKVNKNSYITGNAIIVGNSNTNFNYKNKYYLYDLLTKFPSEFSNQENNNFIYYNGDDIYLTVPLGITADVGELDVTFDQEEPLLN